MNDLAAILERLVRAECEFVLIGGMAAIAHGCTIVTRDVDVVIAMETDNLAKLWHALDGLHPFFRHTRPRRFFTLDDSKRTDWKNLYLETDAGVLDCLGEVKAVGNYRACLDRSVEFEFNTVSMPILDREALIDAKAAIGRERDRQAVNQLWVLGAQEEDS